jgi:hypothetical protein
MTATEKLESMIDKDGLYEILSRISGICGLKAEHFAENWQDHPMERRWLAAEDAVFIALQKIQDIGL